MKRTCNNGSSGAKLPAGASLLEGFSYPGVPCSRPQQLDTHHLPTFSRAEQATGIAENGTQTPTLLLLAILGKLLSLSFHLPISKRELSLQGWGDFLKLFT